MKGWQSSKAFPNTPSICTSKRPNGDTIIAAPRGSMDSPSTHRMHKLSGFTVLFSLPAALLTIPHWRAF